MGNPEVNDALQSEFFESDTWSILNWKPEMKLIDWVNQVKKNKK